MSIDMKKYAGENESPAAVEHTPDLNSYQRELQNEGFPTPPPEVSESVDEIQPVPESKPVEDVQSQNFRALADSVEKLKAERDAERREYQLQLDMLRANVVKGQQAEIPQQKKMFEGMADDDVPSVAEIRKAWGEKESAYNERLEELQVANMHPDYAEILGKYGKQLAETDPLFLQGLRGAENKAMFAYKYAKREQRFQELEQASRNNIPAAQVTQSDTAKRIVENARKPGTLAQAGGQSALSKADYFATMSDAEFMKMASKYQESI